MGVKLDWSEMQPAKKPTRKQRGLYHGWRAYLKDSKLAPEEMHHRAAEYAEQGRLAPGCSVYRGAKR